MKKRPAKTKAKTKTAPKTKAKAKSAAKAKPAAKAKSKSVAKAKAKNAPAKSTRAKKAPARKAKPAKKSRAAKPVRERTYASLDELSAAWNDAGRAYFSEFSTRLTKYYSEGGDVDLAMSDPRSQGMGDQVMRAVIDLNAQGQWQRARELFDPAYSPLMGWIERNDQEMSFVAALDGDELLVRRGPPWRNDGVTFHLAGGQATPLPNITGVHRSRNGDWLVLSRAEGLEIRDARAGVASLGSPPVAALAWPSLDILRPRGISASAEWEAPEGPLAVEQIEISDDGMRVVVSCYRQGILLASRHRDEQPWTLLWPDARKPYSSRDEDDPPSAGDMTHVAISRDGKRLAWGNQDAGHFIAEIDQAGEPQWYATVGYLSEYPHYACFSDDGRYVALNSCHFYNGATISFDTEGNRGVELETYEQHEQAPCIDSGLRVYAACWVDRPVVDAVLDRDAGFDGAFLLAGSGIMRLCAAKGGVASVQGFGSTAGAIDFNRESRRLALSGYSGFVHVYDPYEDELPGRIDGFRPRRELTRWVMWEHLPAGPIRW